MPLEAAICMTAARWAANGNAEFHGYQLAKALAEESSRQLFVAYGTLYRALGRLETMGLLNSRREDPAIAARENRPGRRFYSLTTAGHAAAESAREATTGRAAPRRSRRLAPA